MENNKRFFVSIIISSIILSSALGGLFGYLAGSLSTRGGTFLDNLSSLASGSPAEPAPGLTEKYVKVEEESSVVSVVEKTAPAVVSIIVTKDLPIIERYYRQPSGDIFDQFFGGFFSQPQYRQNGTEKKEVGGGTGFIVSADGYILTNKHVVDDDEAEYTVLMNDESKHSAKVLAKDAFNDLAVLKIEAKDLAFVELGDSSNLKVGQSVITIGNSLGEFRNTVSTGVVSGLARNVTAGGGSAAEELIDVIQTDAAINPGNSGGPLLDISGRAIGINTAIAQGAENIGFSIPINAVKDIYESVRKNGRIVRPWLGVRYAMLNSEIAKANNLEVDEGALVVRGENRTDLAVIPGSPAAKAKVEEGDIIIELAGEKVSIDNPLARIIAKHKVGDEIEMKIIREGKEQKLKLKLEEMKN